MNFAISLITSLTSRGRIMARSLHTFHISGTEYSLVVDAGRNRKLHVFDAQDLSPLSVMLSPQKQCPRVCVLIRKWNSDSTGKRYSASLPLTVLSLIGHK